MKKLLIIAMLGLSMSFGMAAAADGPTASKIAAKAPAKAQTRQADLVGVWRSDERTPKVSPGTLTLTADARVTLAPDGFDPLVGTYKVQGLFLDLKTDRGTASIVFNLSPNALMLEYEDGSVQNFKKQQPAGRTGTSTPKKDVKK